MPLPVLHLLCGKIASGKSTLTRTLGAAPGTVTLSEDDWIATLYGDEITSMAAYMARCERLRDVMQPHILSLLGAGVSVVLDFQANTVHSRAWLRSLVDRAGVDHVLHHLDVPDAICKARLRERNAAGTHAFSVSEAQFDQITRHFVPPRPDEGFTLRVHRPEV